MTFEDACKIQRSIATADNFRRDGIAATMQKVQEAIAPWTSESLAQEGARRMHERIAEMGKRGFAFGAIKEQS